MILNLSCLESTLFFKIKNHNRKLAANLSKKGESALWSKPVSTGPEPIQVVDGGLR